MDGEDHDEPKRGDACYLFLREEGRWRQCVAATSITCMGHGDAVLRAEITAHEARKLRPSTIDLAVGLWLSADGDNAHKVVKGVLSSTAATDQGELILAFLIQ